MAGNCIDNYSRKIPSPVLTSKGIFVSSPQMCYGVHFRKGLLIGETTKSEQELKKILVDLMYVLSPR
jgi:hypothetical protein